MLVKCPSCATTYKVADEILTGTAPAFRCSRCKHMFEGDLDASVEAVPLRAESESKIQGEDEGELAFVFEAEDQDPRDDRDQDGINPPPPTHFPPPDPVDSLVEQETQRWSVPAEIKAEEPFTISGDPRSQQIEGKPDRHEDGKRARKPAEEVLPTMPTSNISSLEPYRDQQTSTLPYLSLFALLILFFSLATAFQYAYPKVLDGWMKKVPFIGAAIARNDRLKEGVALQSLRGNYQVIQGNREIFVVTGVAMNQNPVVIREVRIGGETFGSDEKSIEQQEMWIGNAISAKIIRGMTAQDISDLQRLKPLKTFEIPPGDSVPFTIVFLKPAKAVKKFTATVMTAEEET
ncbi:MAG TPA: zinc-ribbon domain-containing protein [Candidatus Binatia bacterium]